VATPHAKVLDYAIGIDTEGRWLIEDAAETIGEAWTAEHLVLAGLVRCSLTSLGYHARRAEIAVAASRGAASGKITRRDSDGLYAFIELDVALDVVLEPRPDDLAELLMKAERGCFISASLTVRPRYAWTVNGAPAAASAPAAPA
jgi:organic hydroperoxide reductase OsmC/OhrA